MHKIAALLVLLALVFTPISGFAEEKKEKNIDSKIEKIIEDVKGLAVDSVRELLDRIESKKKKAQEKKEYREEPEKEGRYKEIAV